MVTRADVARRAGTSTAVVSYVINDGPRPVATETRERVLRAIADLDYRPNLAAQVLRGRSSHVFGLIVPDISNPFYAELARAIEEVAERRGYTLILGNSEQQAEREISYVRTFIDRKVDGLFLISGSSSKQLSALFSKIDLPHVLLDRRINYTGNATLLATDGAAGARLATEHLLALGHTRIAALCGPAHMGTDRANGYRRTMEDAGLAAAVHHSGEFDRRSAYLAARAILAQPRPPTAIFASNDVAGISVLRAAADLGMSVPGDLAVVAFDDIQEGQYSVPRLTTVAQPIEELGRLATEKLISLIQVGKAASEAPSMQLVTPTLIVRESCGASGRLSKE
jgi:LacI family transcriptional regulator